jgi:hypothetical protein
VARPRRGGPLRSAWAAEEDTTGGGGGGAGTQAHSWPVGAGGATGAGGGTSGEREQPGPEQGQGCLEGSGCVSRGVAEAGAGAEACASASAVGGRTIMGSPQPARAAAGASAPPARRARAPTSRRQQDQRRNAFMRCHTRNGRRKRGDNPMCKSTRPREGGQGKLGRRAPDGARGPLPRLFQHEAGGWQREGGPESYSGAGNGCGPCPAGIGSCGSMRASSTSNFTSWYASRPQA